MTTSDFTDTILVVRQTSHLKSFGKAEVFSGLSDAERASAPDDFLVDMNAFANDAENGGWSESNNFLRSQASVIHQQARELNTSRLHYYGLAEIPHVIALAAYLGDELPIEIHEYERDAGDWNWPSDEQSLFVQVEGTPAEKVDAAGDAIIRVAITSEIQDSDIAAVVHGKPLADIIIRPQETKTQKPTLVQSPADVKAISDCFRDQLAALLRYRPGTQVIHLFIAAPVSVCFAIGRELRLRNTCSVQTYRYRAQSTPALSAAIRLQLQAEPPLRELTKEELEITAQIRGNEWPEALKELQAYARSLKARDRGNAKKWYEPLHWYVGMQESTRIHPYRGLPVVWEVIGMGDTADSTPFTSGPYALDPRSRQWRLSDELLLGLWTAVSGNKERLKRLIRLFLFHEYVHEHHVLTKVTADQVGRFENCLERLDYGADLYALLHEFDLSIDRGLLTDDSDKAKQQFLADQIDQIILSFWAFEEARPALYWQVRRVRRHLNWYWRQVQVQHAPDLTTALRILASAPSIEMTGLHHFLEGRRYLVEMEENKVVNDTDLELGLVTENDGFVRISNATNTNLKELIVAFREGNHEAIKAFFDSVFKFVKQANGAFPPSD